MVEVEIVPKICGMMKTLCRVKKRGEKHPMYGKKHNENWRLSNSLSHIGYKHTEESKKKMSISRTGGKRNDETKMKMSIAQSGENNAMYGRTGETNPACKLTWDKVSEIRELYKKGDTPFRKLAKQFSVSAYTIDSILKNKTWKIENI